jgi:acetyl esterase/lipase
VNVDALLDPEIAEALKAIPKMGDFRLDQIPQIRAQRAAAMPPVELSDNLERTDHRVSGPPGAPDILLRVHRPKGATGLLPCVYWMHGGGYVFGTYEMDDLRFDRWCQNYNCVGVSVEYRLAPETPYPGPVEDAYAGLKWVYQNAAPLGVDRDRIGIGGPSAGGGLAAGLGLLTRDRGEVPFTFQLLIYPMIDDRLVTRSSSWEVPIWSPGANRTGWAAYLGPLAGGNVPIYAAAARATDLSGLPPTLIMVGALDGFLDEDVDYAMRLTYAGVPTELHVFPGAPHGFDGIMPGTALARRGRKVIEEWLAKQLTARTAVPA